MTAWQVVGCQNWCQPAIEEAPTGEFCIQNLTVPLVKAPVGDEEAMTGRPLPPESGQQGLGNLRLEGTPGP